MSIYLRAVKTIGLCSAFAFIASFWNVEALIAQSAFMISPYYNSFDVSQGYSSGHPAYDYLLSYNQVLAADSGTVERVAWYSNAPECHGPVNNSDCGYGLHIYIRHSNGYVTRYGHLSSTAVALGTTNGSVQAGQIIGTSGNTGWSTGSHLHFEVKNQNGGNTDPNNPNLWKDGQWAAPSRAIPQPVDGQQTIQVSDSATNSSSFSKGDAQNPNGCNGNSAGWTRNSNNLWYYTYSNGNTADSWAKWIPQGIPDGGGIYEIYVYVPTANNQSWQVPYTVYNANNPIGYAVVDQLGSGNKWLSIGSYYLTQGAYVRVTDATGETTTRQFAADDVMFVRRGTTYAPDVRSSGGWVSTVYLRSNGGTAKYLFKCINSSGQSIYATNGTLAAHAVTTPVCLVSGTSVVVDASQDVSVVMSKVNSNGKATLDNAFRPTDINSTFEKPSTLVQVPAFYIGYFGFTSQFSIQNVGTAATSNLTVNLLGRTTYPDYSASPSSSIPSNGTWSASFSGASPWAGSLKITSSQQTIAQITEESSNIARSFNGATIGGPVVYVPATYKNYSGLTTGLIVQNLGNAATNVKLTFCFQPTDPMDPAQCPSGTPISGLQPDRAAGLFLGNYSLPPLIVDGWRGSIKVESTTGQSLAVVANNVKNDSGGNAIGGYNFNGSVSGGKVIVLPYAARQLSGKTTGYTLRNAATTVVNVTALYYDMNGSLRYTKPTFSLCRACTIGYYQDSGDDAANLPTNWQGSIMLVASDRILAIMREDKATTDANSGYNGIVLVQ